MKDKSIEEKYDSYIEDFYFKNAEYSLKDIKKGDTYVSGYVFPSLKSILAARLNGISRDDILMNKQSYSDTCNYLDAVRLLRFGRREGIKNLERNEKIFNNGRDVFGELFEYHEKWDIFNMQNWDILGLKRIIPSVDRSFDHIRGNLTYDGIIAYLALAKEEDLIDSKENILFEIERNAKEEMFSVYAESDDGAEKIAKVGEKYIQLECVAGEMFKISELSLDGARREEEQRQVEATAQKEREEDNVANAASAYAEVMENLRRFATEDLTSEEGL